MNDDKTEQHKQAEQYVRDMRAKGMKRRDIAIALGLTDPKPADAMEQALRDGTINTAMTDYRIAKTLGIATAGAQYLRRKLQRENRWFV